MMRIRPLAAVAALLLVAAADRPKPPASALPTLGETIDVSIVNVDVFVTDKIRQARTGPDERRLRHFRKRRETTDHQLRGVPGLEHQRPSPRCAGRGWPTAG